MAGTRRPAHEHRGTTVVLPWHYRGTTVARARGSPAPSGGSRASRAGARRLPKSGPRVGRRHGGSAARWAESSWHRGCGSELAETRAVGSPTVPAAPSRVSCSWHVTARVHRSGLYRTARLRRERPTMYGGSMSGGRRSSVRSRYQALRMEPPLESRRRVARLNQKAAGPHHPLVVLRPPKVRGHDRPSRSWPFARLRGSCAP